MAADGFGTDNEDLEFDPRFGDLGIECTEEHIETELKAPDEEE